MSLTEVENVALGLGVGCVGIVGLILLWNNFMKFEKMTNERLFYIKKWVLVTMLLALNAAGCVMVYYTQSLKIVFGIIVAMKSKDIIMALMFAGNMIYRGISGRDRTPDAQAQERDLETVDKVVVFVPVYEETIEQVNRTIKSITDNVLTSVQILIVIISDGKQNYDGVLDEVNGETVDIYKSWMGKEVKCDIKFGNKNSKKIVYIEKDENVGKKDSIIMVNDLFNKERANIGGGNRIFKINVIKELELMHGTSEYDYIMYTDGDTVLDENAIGCLINTIKNRGAKACCGVVNVDKSTGNIFWNNIQNFQYMYGQYMRRTNEDLMGQVLCLPGCITMTVIDESMVEALNIYSTLPNEKYLFETSVQCVGTDRRLTSSIIYTDVSANILQDTRAHAYTIPPDNFSGYFSQRKRWAQNMFFNSVNNIFGRNVMLLSRLFNVIDVVRMSLIYFRLLNTLFFVYILVKNYKHTEVIRLVPYIVLLAYPAICFMIYALFNGHLRKQYVQMLVYLVINKVLTMLTTIVIFTLMLINIGNSKWRIVKKK